MEILDAVGVDGVNQTGGQMTTLRVQLLAQMIHANKRPLRTSPMSRRFRHIVEVAHVRVRRNRETILLAAITQLPAKPTRLAKFVIASDPLMRQQFALLVEHFEAMFMPRFMLLILFLRNACPLATRRIVVPFLRNEQLRVDSDMDIIIADVPESWGGRIRIGQGCEAGFLSLPDQQFTGNVHAIVHVLSAERRSIRVLLSIHDPQDKLRPGMFAEVGIGTDPREALIAPAEAVIPIGRSDYVLMRKDETHWQVTQVKVGELRDGDTGSDPESCYVLVP